MKLILLPYAGGSKNSYRAFESIKSHNIEFITPELPGRGTRIGQAPLLSIQGMAKDVLEQVQHLISEPYAIFGHSMGALVAYELCKLLIEQERVLPVRAIFSANGAPYLSRPNRKISQLPDQEFFHSLKGYSGLPEELIRNPKAFHLFSSYIRSDFKAVETYRYYKSLPLPIPLSVLIGSDDYVTPGMAYAWSKETRKDFDVQVFTGDHFYIFSNKDLLIKYFEQKLFTY
ncbi:alpha/beta fold hydrolase [Fulvivirga maritima]|uniref:thioesterase II family protein n=1 Tax=Fulvivirga maritima TaxID=2904247 RepID=UPI001F481499|nr:alpha/beta fold hydrolase [Fulvivirga maritima]UII27565.1 alpha/beta fold hydrolase [Fulvivirga maritima]